jgi:hypothetical protein
MVYGMFQVSVFYMHILRVSSRVLTRILNAGSAERQVGFLS